VELIVKKGLPNGSLLNVNVPSVPEKEIRGVRITRQGKTRWDDTFEVRLDPNSKEYYWLTGKLDIIDKSPDTDEIAVLDKYVSITPIHYELTDFVTLKKIKKWNFNRLV
jgi:5'-nucleotidase